MYIQDDVAPMTLFFLVIAKIVMKFRKAKESTIVILETQEMWLYWGRQGGTERPDEDTIHSRRKPTELTYFHSWMEQMSETHLCLQRY